MKSLYLTFDSKDIKLLEQLRKKSEAKSWEQFIIEMAEFVKAGLK